MVKVVSDQLQAEETVARFMLTQEHVNKIINTHVSHSIRIDEVDVLDEVASVTFCIFL